VLLAEADLDPAEETLLGNYVQGGGNLIAMRPDLDLADLFGLTFVATQPEQPLQFFSMDTSREPGTGLTSESLQYHGEADLYTLNGATVLASLWEDMYTPSPYPAVALHTMGQGRSAAFVFDLARSIVWSRQGNPAWKDSEGDGLPGYRPGDLFFRTTGESWLAPERTRIPQADEVQRFLANLILTLSEAPLPRLWYLPDGHKTIMVNTGDAESMAGATLEPIMDDLEGYGGFYTHYLREAGISGTTEAMEAGWRARGHETGPHMWGGGPQTCDVLRNAYQSITDAILEKFGHGSRTARNHTIDWCGWVDMAAIEADYGTGLDTNYYHYLPDLLPYGENANGYFTGSGLPQRFMDEEGNLLPIYQAATPWADEWFADNGWTAEETVQIVQDMFSAAESGYYSAFVANVHHVRYYGADPITYDWANAVWAHARDNGIPLWSAEMLLDFLEARNGSAFNNIRWNGVALSFVFQTPAGGQDLTLMVPGEAGGNDLLSITLDGSPIPYGTETIKGRPYALFTTQASQARVIARYGAADRR